MREKMQEWRESPTMGEFYLNTFYMFLDLMRGEYNFKNPARPGSYKGKHDKHSPEVSSVLTGFKNNWILFVSMGVSSVCYLTAWFPLFFANDAGAFFTDCMTMWTMYVFFFQDPDAINYSY